MDNILSPDFFEFGRSGKVYTREQTIAAEPQEISAILPLKNFQVHTVSDAVVLVTYESEVRYEEIEKANRSSLWKREGDDWKLCFHQGTPLN